jgi:hypothetical protein
MSLRYSELSGAGQAYIFDLSGLNCHSSNSATPRTTLQFTEESSLVWASDMVYNTRYGMKKVVS